MKLAGESFKNLAIRSLLGLKGFGAWLAGVLLDWILSKVSDFIASLAAQFRRKSEVEENQKERSQIAKETEDIIREKEARGETLTEEEIDAIEKKKIKQEEDLFNGRD